MTYYCKSGIKASVNSEALESSMKEKKEEGKQNKNIYKSCIRIWIWSLMWLLLGFSITVLILKQ